MSIKESDEPIPGLFLNQFENQDKEDGKDPKNKKKKAKKVDWLDLIIVSKDSSLFVIKNFCYVLLCLISSYFYGWLAAFGIPDDKQSHDEMFSVMMFFEIFFILSILFNFFVEL